MRVRLPKGTMEKLKKARSCYGLDYSEIAARALRKAARLRPDLSAAPAESTYGGTALRLSAEAEPDYLRRVLRWYLDLQTFRPRPRFDPGLTEGIDYTVKQNF